MAFAVDNGWSAVCTGPEAGIERKNGDRLEYCDGSNWRLIGTPHLLPNSADCGADADKQTYNTVADRMEFCDNASDTKYLTNVADCGVTVAACAGADRGKQRYNTVLNLMQYCNGSFWVNMGSTASQICCPTGFIPVPADAAPYANYNFCVSKYHMKAVKKTNGVPQDDGGPIGSYYPESRADYRPWGNINYVDAFNECASLGPDFHLITNTEWMTIAKSIENNPANWSNNKKPGDVGFSSSDFIPTGHSDGFCPGPPGCQVGQNYLAANSNDALGCDGTGNANCLNKAHADHWQKRTLTLSNGAVIWDFAGNINSWVDPDGIGSTIAYTRALCNPLSPACLQQLNNIYSTNRYASMSPVMATPQDNAFLPATNPGPNWDQNGLGTVTFLSGAGIITVRGFYRGGYFSETRGVHNPGDPRNFISDSTTYDRRGGIYSAWVEQAAASNFPAIGFRCVFRPY